MNNTYGFYISDYDSELKLYVNLSIFALGIIKEDMDNFYFDNRKAKFAGILNTIFSNYHRDAQAAVSQRLVNRYDELKELFSGEDFTDIDEDTTTLYIDKLLLKYEEVLIEDANSYAKGKGIKFRVNNENLDILKTSTESLYYDNKIGNYFKAILEEYASLPLYKREEIIFKEHFDTINSSIMNKKKIKITIMRKINNKNKEFYNRRFYIFPHKIIQDKSSSYNYLVGYSEEINPDGTTKPKTPVSLRISRLDRSSMMNSMNSFISKDDVDALERELETKGVQYLAGYIQNVIIKFNKKGFESYERWLYMRPKFSKKLDTNTYLFEITSVQAINYFLKFGRDLEVLEPQSLRESFITRYKTALEVYEPL